MYCNCKDSYDITRYLYEAEKPSILLVVRLGTYEDFMEDLHSDLDFEEDYEKICKKYETSNC
jgi:hypothetical protein